MVVISWFINQRSHHCFSPSDDWDDHSFSWMRRQYVKDGRPHLSPAVIDMASALNGNIMEIYWGYRLTGWWFGTMEFYDFPFSWEFHHPSWLSLHHFSEGWLNHQPANNLRRCLALLNQPLGRVEIALLIQPSFLLWKNYPPSRKRFQFLWATKRSTMFWNRCALMKEVQNGRNDWDMGTYVR